MFQKSGNDVTQALVYNYNRGDNGDGLQFEGTVSYAVGSKGVESVANFTMFNLPRQQRGEIPQQNALVGIEIGYLDLGAPALSSIFLGHLVYGVPSMDGGTGEWKVYASGKSVSSSIVEWEWVPFTKNEQEKGKPTFTTIGTVVTDLAKLAGVYVVMPDTFANKTVRARTFRGNFLDILANFAKKATRDRILGGTELGAFFVVQDPAARDTYIVIDTALTPTVLSIDTSVDSVYHAGYEITQDQSTSDGVITETEVSANQESLPENILPDDARYVTFYSMELSMRADVFLGVVVETTDPESGAYVRFQVSSIVHSFGSEWTTTIRGRVLSPTPGLLL